MSTLWRSSLISATDEAPRRSTLGLTRRLGLLLTAMIALAPLVVAAGLRAAPHGLGTHTQLGLPPCSLLETTGIPCATCGMTTAFAYAAHGRLLSAFLAQPLGALLAVGCAAVALVCLYALASGADLGPLQRRFARPSTAVAAVVLLLAAWGYKIAVTLAVLAPH